MSDQNQITKKCDCCEVINNLTPLSINNISGLSELTYRIGTHGSFMKSMLYALANEPELAKLTTRDTNDPVIGLMDGWSTVLDVLTFYQERIINEGFLRTATERRSILELARHLSYKLLPGVAASTYLAFKMEEAQGAPSMVIIPSGTKTQSVPGQNQMPQIFETVEEIIARPEWNAISPLQNEKQTIDTNTTKLYLKGTDNLLQPGDTILIVDENRKADDHWNENWDFRILQSIEKDPVNNVTIVSWKESLGQYSNKDGNLKLETKPAANPKVFTFRQRASLFGYNAPEWYTLPHSVRRAYLAEDFNKEKKPVIISNEENFKKELHEINLAYNEDLPNTWTSDWPSNIFTLIHDDKQSIYLDTLYPKILKDSWIVLEKPNYSELYNAINVAMDSRSEFTLSSKSTRIDVGTYIHLDWFPLRQTVVYAQSEQLELAERPITLPIFGNQLTFLGSGKDLKKGQQLLISGILLEKVTIADRSHEIRVGHKTVSAQVKPVEFIPFSREEKRVLEPGEKLALLSPPKQNSDQTYNWNVTMKDGTSGTIKTKKDDLLYEEKNANNITPVYIANQVNQEKLTSEVVTIYQIDTVNNFTTIKFTANLANVYQRNTVVINANVAKATHGESKNEILGNGNGSEIFQKFELKQKPLTYISTASGNGALSTLKIRVNNILWQEVPTFYGCSSKDTVYITKIADDGKVTVQFGDGITGSRLPTGVENIKASFRVGTGLDGLVDAGQISQLMSRPLGLKSVVNPIRATGADNPETRDRARRNAPLTVLTMERIVSLQDFEDFARAFAGISKARADLFLQEEQKIVYITIAAANGVTIDQSSDLYKNLLKSINEAGHKNYRVQIGSFTSRYFNVNVNVLTDKSYIEEDVLAKVSLALTQFFSFENRDFDQIVTPSEVISVIQKVKGVIAVDLNLLDGIDPNSTTHFSISPAPRDQEKLIPAELIMIKPTGIEIHRMSL